MEAAVEAVGVEPGATLRGLDLEAIEATEERMRFAGLVDRLGIPQPQGGMAGKFLQHHLAPRPCQRRFRPHADDFSVIGIGKDQPTARRQQICGEVGIHRPEKPVTPRQIALPFLIGAEIGAAGFAFDHPDLALWPEGHQINPQPRRRHQFLDRDEIELPQRTRHPARKALAGHRGKAVLRLHRKNMHKR